MPGLYDRVQRSPRQKTFPWWAVILAIALVVLTCIGLLIIRPLCIKNRYEACMDAVAASTIYAKRHRGVRALVDGQELRLRESNARSMYSTLATLGVGHFTDRLPEGAPNASQTAILEQAKAAVPGASWADLYTPLWEHKGEDIFYRTDHHWTSLGAYYGYTGLATALGYTPVPLNDYTETVRSTEFYGTVFSSSGVRWVRPDTISTYVPDDGITVASHTYDNKGNPVEEPRQLYDTSFLSVKDKYSMFLGGNQPLGVVKNANNPDGPRLLIIRDSYADSLVPFLTPHFSEIHLLDLRYYKLSIADYIAQNGIDQALVLYSVPNFVTDSNLLWIAK